MKTELCAQNFDIHKTHTANNSHPLVKFYMDKTETLHYGVAFHKWKEEKSDFMCVIDLGTDESNIKEKYLEFEENLPNTDDIENGIYIGSEIFIYKFYGRIWKPIERKKNEWKYKKLPVRNHVYRVIKS